MEKMEKTVLGDYVYLINVDGFWDVFNSNMVR